MKIINCEGLSKKYKEKEALRNITFSVEGTGCVGFLGANGSGKTTTMRILCGLARPTSGKVEVIGHDVTKNASTVRKELGYVPQSPSFYNYMTGEEWMKWIGSIYDIDKKNIKAKSKELLSMCGIWDARNRKIGGYSGGMKQRLAISQALINNPKLLILDEPLSALDPLGRYDVIKLIENNLKNDMTVFISSHILDDISRVADRVVIIDNGSVLLSDSMDELLKKYQSEVINFTLQSTNNKDILNLLKQKSWVSQVSIDGAKFILHPKQFQNGKKELLKFIIEENLSLTSYDISSTTLENIFLKVVNK